MFILKTAAHYRGCPCTNPMLQWMHFLLVNVFAWFKITAFVFFLFLFIYYCISETLYIDVHLPIYYWYRIYLMDVNKNNTKEKNAVDVHAVHLHYRFSCIKTHTIWDFEAAGKHLSHFHAGILVSTWWLIDTLRPRVFGEVSVDVLHTALLHRCATRQRNSFGQ